MVTVYKCLILQQPINYEDMEAAIEQCEELLFEINITNYLLSVCKHFNAEKTKSEDSDSSSCKDVRRVHNLIKEKFKKIINVAFRQISVYPDLYYCLPYWKTGDAVSRFYFQNFLNEAQL